MKRREVFFLGLRVEEFTGLGVYEFQAGFALS